MLVSNLKLTPPTQTFSTHRAINAIRWSILQELFSFREYAVLQRTCKDLRVEILNNTPDLFHKQTGPLFRFLEYTDKEDQTAKTLETNLLPLLRSIDSWPPNIRKFFFRLLHLAEDLKEALLLHNPHLIYQGLNFYASLMDEAINKWNFNHSNVQSLIIRLFNIPTFRAVFAHATLRSNSHNEGYAPLLRRITVEWGNRALNNEGVSRIVEFLRMTDLIIDPDLNSDRKPLSADQIFLLPFGTRLLEGPSVVEGVISAVKLVCFEEHTTLRVQGVLSRSQFTHLKTYGIRIDARKSYHLPKKTVDDIIFSKWYLYCVPLVILACVGSVILLAKFGVITLPLIYICELISLLLPIGLYHLVQKIDHLWCRHFRYYIPPEERRLLT